jgi:hypothetical protein
VTRRGRSTRARVGVWDVPRPVSRCEGYREAAKVQSVEVEHVGVGIGSADDLVGGGGRRGIGGRC